MDALNVLLVDDDKNIRQTLRVSLKNMNCDVETAESAEEAFQAVRKGRFDFVLTDFRMTGKNGVELIQDCRGLSPAPVMVVMTAFASFENAVAAIQAGAFDYLPKPFSTAQLDHVLRKVRAIISLRKENEALRSMPFREDYFSGMTSPAMMRLEEFVNNIAPTDATVLMTGESGTGKSDLARIIHRRSNRAKGPFVVINCTSLAESLLESELFGHVKGAFTGAISDHVGKFEAAAHGTVFLDEVGDLSPNGQAKLLRVLQERVIERVGSNKAVTVDVRVIAATNKNLEEAVKAGKFREDLYYRLNMFECSVVPLRHRKEDIPLLCARFLHESSVLAGEPQDKRLPDAVTQQLFRHSWPGNIRELKNVVERLVILSRNREVSVDDLPSSFKASSETDMAANSHGEMPSLEELEKRHIEQALKRYPNQEQAAQILGITTVTLWRKRKQYGLP